MAPKEIVFDNPFFQTKTKKHDGCQIDYLIQTRFNNLFICEIKFSKNPVSSKVIAEVENKIDKLVIPKNFSCHPVLIHVGGVADSVIDSGFFGSIVDIGTLLR